MLARLNLGQMNVGDTVRVVGLDKADRAYRETICWPFSPELVNAR